MSPWVIIRKRLQNPSQTFVERNWSALFPIAHLRAWGVNSVVTMTAITTMLKVAALTPGLRIQL
jgi:hypothetical protein